MHCKVALLFLLGITAINARIIASFSHPSYHTQALGDLRLPLRVEEPSRHLLPPFEDYGDAQLYSNGIFRSVQPHWQLANELQETHEQSQPQPYSYDVINRVLEEVEQPTDFQPFEPQITQDDDNVKNVQETVNDFENYLHGVAATLTPQNKAKSGVLKITMVLAPKLGEVPVSSLAEEDFANSISSVLVDDSTNSESAKRENEFEKFLSNLFGEDSTETASAKKAPEIVNILRNKNLGSFDDYIIEEDSAKMEKELEKLLSSTIEEINDNTKKEREFVNNLQKILEENIAESETALENLGYFDGDSIDKENAKKEKELEVFLSSLPRVDNTDNNGANDLSEKADQNNDDEQEIEESFDSYLNKILAAEAQEEEEEEAREPIVDLFENYLEELEGSDYLNSIASSPLDDDYFVL